MRGARAGVLGDEMWGERFNDVRDAAASRSGWRRQRPRTLDDQQDVSTREAAAILGRSERSVQRAVAKGEIGAIKVGTAYRISRDELRRVAGGSLPPPSEPPQGSIVALPAQAERMAPLPAPLSSFVGRDSDLHTITALLLDPTIRLLTLTGPGGIGKTRLAMAAAGLVPASRFPDGVAFVGLADLTSPEMVVPAMAQALGIRPHANRDPAEQLRAFMRRNHLLLVLDNFEHLLTAGSEVASLLVAAPGITALVTSRAPLRVTGERELAVQPLTIADRHATAAEVLVSDAGRLFAERAREHHAAFTVDDASAPLIAELCARLDGLPLAIELAAARSKVLPPHQLLARLEQRLPLLTCGPQNAPARHSTMRDAIAWSYELLSPPEQRFFRRLAVFAGGFTLEGAGVIGAWGDRTEGDGVIGSWGDRGMTHDCRLPNTLTPYDPITLDAIASLVDQSLLVVEADRVGERRFRMLETIREFALERLAAADEEDAARAALANYMVTLVGSFGAPEHLSTPPVLDRLEASQADLHAVLAWLEHHDPAAFVRLVAALPSYWYARGHYREARKWLERALPHAAVAAALDVARMQVGLSRFQILRGEYAAAAAGFDQGIPRLRQQGSKVETAVALMWRAGMAIYTSDHEVAEAKFAEACQVAELVDDPRTRAKLLGLLMVNLGVAARSRGEFDLAEMRLQRAQEQFQAHDKTLGADEVSMGMTYLTIDAAGHLALDRGDYPRALEHFHSFLNKMEGQSEMQSVEEALVGAARVATAWERFPEAASLFAMADTLQAQLGLGMILPGDLASRERDLATVRTRLGEAEFAAAWREGQPFSLSAARAALAALAPPAPAGEVTSAKSSRSVDALTRRERDIMHLLAEHQSDREIAEALFLSLRTVNWHVRSILAKLGATSRREAVLRAREDGLV